MIGIFIFLCNTHSGSVSYVSSAVIMEFYLGVSSEMLRKLGVLNPLPLSDTYIVFNFNITGFI
jgi:hypothetical protein